MKYKFIRMSTLSTVKPYVIGLDLGGTNSVFGIVDSRGEIKATTTIKTQGYATAEDYVDAVSYTHLTLPTTSRV